MVLKTLAAALVAVALWPGDAMAQKVVDYKGRQIQVAAGEPSARCLALLQKAIDMTAELAPKQKALAAEVKDLRCGTIPDRLRTNAVEDNTIGVYTMATPDSPMGYIRFPLEADRLSAAEIVLSLVGNGGYARLHRSYLAAKARAAGDPAAKAEAERLRRILTHADKAAMLKNECELLANERDAIKALDLGERQLRSNSRQMNSRGCG
jgi:hypothetical protein